MRPLPLAFLFAALAGAQTLETAVPLPGVRGRIDHLAADVAGQRLFVAALGNNTVEVVDLRMAKRIRSITGLSEPQGVAFTGDRLFVANGGDGAVRAYDAATLAPLGGVKTTGDADNLRYDAAARELWAGYGNGALGLIDPASLKLAATVDLGHHPESFQLAGGSARIFVNLPRSGQVAVVDRSTRTVTARWTVSAGANYPMALDEAGHRLFVSCRRPARVLLLDTETGREIASVATSGDADDIFFDSARRRLYAICGEGFLDVFSEKAPRNHERTAHIATAPGARTGLFVPDLGRLYVALRKGGNHEAEIRIFKLE